MPMFLLVSPLIFNIIMAKLYQTIFYNLLMGLELLARLVLVVPKPLLPETPDTQGA